MCLPSCLRIFSHYSIPDPDDAPVGEPVDPDPLPAVEDGSVAVALVELAPIAAAGQPLTIGAPCHAGQTVLIAVAHLGLVS